MKKLTVKDNRNVFYIADTHFGHANIIRHCGRPFTTVETMDDAMIRSWNEVVGPEDLVIVGGDFAFKGLPQEKYARQLKGEKVLVMGNHDKTPPKGIFTMTCDMLCINHRGRKIIVCHYPLVEWDGFYRDAMHFYGHIHNNDNQANRIMSEIKGAYNIGADILGFSPRTANEIITMFS